MSVSTEMRNQHCHQRATEIEQMEFDPIESALCEHSARSTSPKRDRQANSPPPHLYGSDRFGGRCRTALLRGADHQLEITSLACPLQPITVRFGSGTCVSRE
jgi:hypothetical protein